MNYCPYCCGPVDSQGKCLEKCGKDPHGDYGIGSVELRPGTKLRSGTLVLGCSLGQGGFGITYAAWDTQLKRRVAVKESYPSTAGAQRRGSEVMAMPADKELFNKCQRLFKRETDSLKQVRNIPNVIKVLDDFAENGTYYYVMDYVKGKSLQKTLEARKDKRMNWDELGPIMKKIMSALKKVHEFYIIHRDIAPDNIMLDQDMQPVLVDFGATKYFGGEITNSTGIIRKPHYSPYEQCTSGKDVGTWSDVYALGATMYRALSGKNPVDAMDRINEDSLLPLKQLNPSVPDYVNDAIMKAMTLNFKKRYQTVHDFSAALWKETEPPLEEAYPPKLLSLEGCLKGKTITFEKNMTFGRQPDCNICLNNGHVSRHHCEISYNSQKQTCSILDRRSTNGTMVDRGKKTIQLEPDKWLPLEDGDIIYIGPFDVFKYEAGKAGEEKIKTEPGENNDNIVPAPGPAPRPFVQSLFDFLGLFRRGGSGPDEVINSKM